MKAYCLPKKYLPEMVLMNKPKPEAMFYALGNRTWLSPIRLLLLQRITAQLLNLNQEINKQK